MEISVVMHEYQNVCVGNFDSIRISWCSGKVINEGKKAS